MKKNIRALVLVVILVIFGGLIAWYKLTPGPYDNLATCLKEKGAVFYGAFWCPHCQATKNMFGKSAKLLPYVECSTPDGKGQQAVCAEKQITGYPTWVFPDGTRMSGELSVETLAETSNCPLN